VVRFLRKNQKNILENGKSGEIGLVRKFTRTGRPLGNKNFLKNLEKLSGRILETKKPGRPKIN
jgi:hypothetical protein